MKQNVLNGLAKVSNRSNKILAGASVALLAMGTNSFALTATDVDFASPITDVGIILVALIGLGVAVKGARKVIGMLS